MASGAYTLQITNKFNIEYAMAGSSPTITFFNRITSNLIKCVIFAREFRRERILLDMTV